MALEVEGWSGKRQAEATLLRDALQLPARVHKSLTLDPSEAEWPISDSLLCSCENGIEQNNLPMAF